MTSPAAGSDRVSASGPGRSPSATSRALLAEGSAAGTNLQPAGDPEDDDRDAGDVEPRATSRLGVAADRVDMAAERRPFGQEGQADEKDDDEDAGQRQPFRHAGVVGDRDGAEARDRDAEELGDNEQRSADRHARAALADHAAQRADGVETRDGGRNDPTRIGFEVVVGELADQ